jgi:hypothetical protein
MRALIPLLVASLATLAFSVSPVGSSERAGALAPIRIPPVEADPIRILSPAARSTRVAPRVACGRPGRLRLRRFEDRSARLECGERVLVRVSVPG